MNKITAFALCAILAISTASFAGNKSGNISGNYSNNGNDDVVKQALANTSEGKMFADLALTTADGKSAKLSDFVGKGKYVLIDFWASWCGWCIKEMPTLAKLQSEYKGKKLVILGVNLDKDKNAAVEAVKKHNMIWKQVYINKIDDVSTVYGVRGIPETILFAPDGKIVKRSLRGDELIDFIHKNVK
ncbi:MAG: TlpA family protein disulfide reductase [Candidatus Egerieousia sp.]